VIRRLGIALTTLLLVSCCVFYLTLPDVRPLRGAWPRTTSFMERRKAQLAREGKTVRLEWSPVPLSSIAPAMRRAVIIAEDARFWEHRGVDWPALRGALRRDFERGDLKVGGSTITQQLAKNLYLSPARTPWRKLRELAIANRLERTLPKSRILELYLNVIEFGPRTFGVEAAARRYLGKPARDLSPEEAALLAAVIPSPRIYDPVRQRARAQRRARRILRAMG
jgi:monofunctional glycosyltransferase